MSPSRHRRTRRFGDRPTKRLQVSVAVVSVLIVLAAAAHGVSISLRHPDLRVVDVAATTSSASPTVTPTPSPTPTWTTLTRAGHVWIGGQPTAGHTWLARTSGWPQQTTFTYVWSLDRTVVKTSSSTADTSYVAPASAFNHMVSLAVTGTAPGDGPATITLAPLRAQGFNPLAGDQWPADLTPPSVDGNNWDRDLVQNYLNARATSRALQGKIATRPRATWFGGWLAPAQAASMVRNYITAVQNGNPHALVQLTLHTIWTLPGAGGEDGRIHPLTAAQIATYRQWMAAVAGAVGTQRVAIIMEPDLAELPKAMSGNTNTADPVVRAGLVAEATKLLAKNPNAAIYLDAGDSDWQPVSTMVPWLKMAGIQYARGFALGATHYSKAADNLTYGAAMVKALAANNLPGKHYVIDTADNGQGFTWQQWATAHGGGTFNNASPCTSTSGPAPCASLGVPPTWQIIDTRLPLTDWQKFAALRQLDGYLWFSRPWLPWQSGAYSVSLAQGLAASSPYA